MIKGLHTRGSYIYVNNGGASNYVNGQPGAQGLGNIRFNTVSQQLEIFDGLSWLTLNLPTPVIGLTAEAESLLDWVKEQKQKEDQLEKLVTDNEAVRNAYNNLQKAKEQLYLTMILSNNEKTTS